MSGVAAWVAHGVALSPCVWIKFGSRRCKWIIEEIVRDILWLQDYAIDGFRVVVGTAIWAAYDSYSMANDEWDLNLDLDKGFRLSEDVGVIVCPPAS